MGHGGLGNSKEDSPSVFGKLSEKESKRSEHIDGKNMCWQLFCEIILFLPFVVGSLQTIFWLETILSSFLLLVGITHKLLGILHLNAFSKFSLPAFPNTALRATCPTHGATSGLMVKTRDLITPHKPYNKAVVACSEASYIQPLLWACSVLFLWYLVSVFTILTNAEKIWSHTFMSLSWSYLLF